MISLVILAIGVLAFLALLEAGLDVILITVILTCVVIACFLFAAQYFAICLFFYSLAYSVVAAVKKKWKQSGKFLLYSVGGVVLAFLMEAVPWLR